MAKYTAGGIDGFILEINELAKLPDDVVDDMLNAQADVVVAAIKAKGKAMGVHRTGLTLASIKKGKVKRRDGEGPSIIVSPRGQRPNGRGKMKTNSEVAFIQEYGKRGIKARPFMRTAIEESATATTAAGEKIYRSHQIKIIEGKGGT